MTDFDLDSWLDEIEPPHRRQTVNTRGDLLGQHAALAAEHEHAQRALEELTAQHTPGEIRAETIGSDPHAAAREQSTVLRDRIAALANTLKSVEQDYAGNHATFTFKAISPEVRESIATDNSSPDAGGVTSFPDQTLRLFLASVTSIDIVRNGAKQAANIAAWTPEVLVRFLAKIGDAQAAKLWVAYSEVAVSDIHALEGR